MHWFWKGTQDGHAEAAEPVAGLLSDVGCCRKLNEDSARIVRTGRRHPGLLVVVADGMGGHEAGEIASQAAVTAIESVYQRARGTPGQALEQAFHRAHQVIRELAARNPALSGMGTTCTALAIAGAEAWAAHVGDSRLYLVRGEGIYQLSEDHSQCMEMVRQGLLTLEQARRHEDRNVLIHAMGTREDLQLMLWPQPMAVRPGDTFVLCTDGLHDLVAAPEIRELVASTAPGQACRQLVKMARERGGYDNITVAVVRIPGFESGPEQVKETREIEVSE